MRVQTMYFVRLLLKDGSSRPIFERKGKPLPPFQDVEDLDTWVEENKKKHFSRGIGYKVNEVEVFEEFALEFLAEAAEPNEEDEEENDS